MSLGTFHPAVARWFTSAFGVPTAAQQAAWPAIAQGRHTLIAAPTGSGKTLAAFLSAIDSLVRQAASGELQDQVQVVYVSPLKALSNDISRNLEQPLAGCLAELQNLGLPSPGIRSQVRTGDTPQAERAAMLKRPPHILVTTPESLYLLLTSESGRRILGTTRTVIIDEIHAVAATKRGAHLALSLERLADLCGRKPQRVGLSATQKPIEDVARFLVGSAGGDCAIVDSGHVRHRDLALVLPDSPLEAVMSAEVWNTLYDRIAKLIDEHRTTLIFANTRRMVERVTRHLSERIGAENIAAHHGSLAKEQRFDAEQRLKAGKLKAMVATASLELGIDIGDVELVCQLGSPRAISTFLQRVGRANHAVGGVPKGRLFPLSRDELVECTALLDAVQAGELDRLRIPVAPIDVLSQQIVAEVASGERGEDELFDLVRRAWPYRNLERSAFDELVGMLSDGISTRRGRQSAYLHRDAVNSRLRARRGARLTAITCGGAIPQNADFQVVMEPQSIPVGTLNEDFAIESMAGDVFQLGNTSYRILRVEAGKVRVEDAAGQAPTIPFWLGEAPARTDELSEAVARLRSEVDAALPDMLPQTMEQAIASTAARHGVQGLASQQLVEYLAAAKATLGRLPTRDLIIVERFFDEGGGMQLIIHAPYGARVNRGFGLALRKRFCQTFNFELQAAATEDAIILSLGETHSFDLNEVVKYLHSNTVEYVLTQAVLDSPMFQTRWRWNATISLAVKTSRGGRKTPPALLRMAAEDLVSVLFPDQLACLENIQGPREIPDHPLVRQTLHDCLHEAMDIDGLITLLRRIENGEVTVLVRDLPHPSMLSMEILTARPYAFLDDAPLEERRTLAVAARRWLDPQSASEFGKLDPAAIAQLREEAWPDPGTADELHDALMLLGALPEAEGRGRGNVARPDWQPLFESLCHARRATTLCVGARRFWVAAEQLPLARALHPEATMSPEIVVPSAYAGRTFEPVDAARELLRGRLQATGPVTAELLDSALALPGGSATSALLALEGEGFALRGQFSPDAAGTEWCERRLLARINRYTLRSLRAQVEPLASADFMRFLLEWQGVTRDPKGEGPQSVAAVLDQLEGFEVPAVAWERDVLPARLHHYDPSWLDALCLSGRTVWARLDPPKGVVAGPVRSTPIALLSRQNLPLWRGFSQRQRGEVTLSSSAQAIADLLAARGASFFDELMRNAGLLQSQAEGALGELVAAGLVSADSFGGLRALLLPLEARRRLANRGRRIALFGLEEAGRWSLLRPDVAQADDPSDPAQVEQIAWRLLQRYGVVFRRLLTREAPWLPPWHALLRVLRRLESQGHVRGGRFVTSASGEQYALPDAVPALRAMRQKPTDGELVSLSAADPLNLLGIITPGERLAAVSGNRFVLRDGVPIALHAAGETRFIAKLTVPEEWTVRNALLRRGAATAVATNH